MNKKPLAKTRVHNEYSAGGIVFRRTSRGLEMAFLLDPFSKWTFAKGHIEPRETIVGAALREVREELGIKRLRIVAPLGRIDWWFRERRGGAKSPKGALVHKFTYYFLMETPRETVLRPQRSELIKAARFIPVTQALRISGYKDVRPVLQKALHILERQFAKRYVVH